MKLYMTMDSSTGGKFWEIVTKGKNFTTRFGKIGVQGRSTTKSYSSKSECEKEAKKLIKKKKDKGYSEKKGKKRKQLDESSDEESSDSEPPQKKRKIANKNKNKKPTRRRTNKRKKFSSEEEESASESESEVSDDGYGSADDKNEKLLRKMLNVSSVLLKDLDEKKQFEIKVEGKTYCAVQGKIGSTNGKKKTKKFTSKKKAFEAAMTLLIGKMRDDWSIVESDEEGESEEKSEEEEEGIFNDYKFVLSGSFSVATKRIKELINENDGTVQTSVSKKTDFLLVKDENVSLNSVKCKNAIALDVVIVIEDYLHDCIDKNEKLDYKKYVVEQEEEDDEDVQMKDKNKNKKKLDDKTEKDDDDESSDEEMEKKKKSTKKVQKFKGSAPVDEHFNDGDISGYSVYEEDGVVYDAMLNQTNIGKNNNKFYKLQVLQADDDSNEFHTWFRWARVGYKGQTKDIPSDKDECIEKFKTKFYDKTLNHWEDRNDFEARAKKYTYLPMDYGGNNDSDSDEQEEKNDEIKSKLSKDIQNLVKLIFNKETWESQLKEIGYDAEKLPLGKVDKSIITKAYKILKDIESELRSGNKNNSEEEESEEESDDNSNRRSKRKKTKSSRRVSSSDELEALTSRYYTLIPHEFKMKKPELIDSEKKLKKEMKLIESLNEIEVATRLLKDSKKKNIEKHPLDKNFDVLKCDMESINKNTDEFKMLADYVKLTHAETHNRYTLSVETAYKLDRDGSQQRFNKFSDNHNRMLLWHGSRLTNFVGIISQGLRIAPPEAPVTGYMFGKGVYFADMCSKSANYCFTTANSNTGLILLCEVALGDMNEKHGADYYAADLPQGKLSTKGVGRTSPDPKTYCELDNGCIVPMGKGIKDNKLRTQLLYNEYIVYDTAQIKMKYLLRLKFDYKSNDSYW